MTQNDHAGARIEYEKVVAYSLLLSEALFEVLKLKGLLTHAEISESMERLNKELVCRTAGIDLSKRDAN